MEFNIGMLQAEDIAEIEELFEDADVSLIKEIIYLDGWSDWEECGGYLIFLGIDDCIHYCEYGYCVMATDNTNYFEPVEITRKVAEEMIREMDKEIKDG